MWFTYNIWFNTLFGLNKIFGLHTTFGLLTLFGLHKYVVYIQHFQRCQSFLLILILIAYLYLLFPVLF